jgi:uncharacterized membrane protein YkoI
MQAILVSVILALSPVAFSEDDGKLTIDIPSSVQATIAREKGDAGKVRDFRRVNESDGATYVVGIVMDGRMYQLTIDAAGRVMRKELEEDGESKPLQISAVPAKVQQTLQREAGAGVIGDIEKIEDKTRYATEVIIGKRKYRIEVDAAGILLKKEYLGDEE